MRLRGGVRSQVGDMHAGWECSSIDQQNQHPYCNIQNLETGIFVYSKFPPWGELDKLGTKHIL